MALPSSGTISLGMVINEFGGGNNLRDFFRGGAYVPDTPANSGVPTSGTIRLRHLLGASAGSSLSVSISPSPLNLLDPEPPYSVSGTLTATVSGGSGSKSYSWTKISGHSSIVFTGSSSNSTVGVTSDSIVAGQYTATIRVVVSDSSGSTSSTVQVTITHGNLQ